MTQNEKLEELTETMRHAKGEVFEYVDHLCSYHMLFSYTWDPDSLYWFEKVEDRIKKIRRALKKFKDAYNKYHELSPDEQDD